MADHSRAVALGVELRFIRPQNGPYFSVAFNFLPKSNHKGSHSGTSVKIMSGTGEGR